MMYLFKACWLLCLTYQAAATIGPHLPSGGILYPRDSEIREVVSLDGIWNFIFDSYEQNGIREKWFTKNISMMDEPIPMPVPSSYNDITPYISNWNHVGLVWYERQFFVPNSWRTQGFRVWLRFGSVNYFAQVWVNGEKVMEHEIGHLPFKSEITSFVKFGQENQLTVAVDNILSNETIPQGSLHKIETLNDPLIVQKYTFDFYNYAGIHRSVHLYTTPKVFIDDIDLSSDVDNSQVHLNYTLYYKGYSSSDIINTTLSVIDKEGIVICFETYIIKNNVGNVSGRVKVENPKLWWPYLMDPEPGYLYTIKISLHSSETDVTDVYRMPFGLRSITWDNSSVYINSKPIYIRGFGRHEDSDIRGKGFDLPTSVKDHNLLKWIGANAYRTSHYPYAEEIMDLAESQGIMIIDECPAVNIELFTPTLLEKHKTSIAEMIQRDKNRACVIMWSVANEPRSSNEGAGPYFGSVVDFTRTLDKSKPITAALFRAYYNDQAAQFMDVICFNRYYAWFSNPGEPGVIQPGVVSEAQHWRDRYFKPVIMSEYGADTYEGLHSLPNYIWTEEYQAVLLSEHFKAFDSLREKGWFIGEMIWNFADFKTDQSIKRVGGNKKGIFTRQRQPKTAAFLVRKRYFELALMLDGAKPPSDLVKYTSLPVGYRDEL